MRACTTTKKHYQHLSPVWTHSPRSWCDHGEGCYLYDQDGTRYLDFTCGIGVTNTGHCHPHVVEAIRKQAGLLLHGQANIVFAQAAAGAGERAAHGRAARPWMGSSSATPAPRRWKGRSSWPAMPPGGPNVIVFQGSFHGRTVGTMSLTTSKTIYRAGYQPLCRACSWRRIPMPIAMAGTKKTTSWCLEELEYLLISPDRAAGNGCHPDRAGAGRGRLRGAAGRLSARACARSATSTASC